MHVTLDHGPLALALAMFVGVVAQAIARHVRVPGIVLLLSAGVGLGPDGANLIRPAAMGAGLSAVVGFSVAIILFEGGFSLQLDALRRQGKAIRRLVTIGALVTAILGAVVVHPFMGWDWRLSVLFGTLVIVTGPTVVTPLLQRLRVSPKLSSILIAEGILIDAVGATIAVVALEIVVAPSAAAQGVLSIATRIGTGAVVGLAGGLVIAGAHKARRLVPHGLENVFVLGAVVATYHLSDAFVHESGITAAIVAGLVVGNAGIRVEREVARFNEELTALLVATLFVLLAADVRLADVEALGWRGAAVALGLIFIVRPANVFVSTRGTDLTTREKLYLSWIAPRGIVAAAVASLFAAELARVGIPGGVQMRALVFVLIAATVVVQGLTAAPVAQLLGVRMPSRAGYLFLGTNELAIVMGTTLRQLGESVLFIDRNAGGCAEARRAGFEVVEADGLRAASLISAGIDRVRYAIAMTTNEHVNVLFAQTVANELRGPEIHVALERFVHGVTPEMVERVDGHVLFGAEHDLLLWRDHARRGLVKTSRWKLGEGRRANALSELPTDSVMFLVLVRGGSVAPFSNRTSLRDGDEVIVAIVENDTRGAAWMQARGWSEVQASANASGRTPVSA